MTQNNWRWCNKCQGLAFAGNPSQGVCPAGGTHSHSGSGDYTILKDVNVPIPYGQDNWRWCRKCEALTYAGNSELGTCPANGTHDHRGSGDYQLLRNLPISFAGYQDNWRWCFRCQGMTYAGNASPGYCPAAGLHEHSGSANYSLHQA